MSTSIDKIKAQEDRRAAIRRQMEAMEAAAEPKKSSSSSSVQRRHTGSSTDSQSNVETARRFLVDEDDDEDLPLQDSRNSPKRRSYAETSPKGGGSGENIWSSMKSTFNILGSGTGKAQPASLRKDVRLAEINLKGEQHHEIDEEEPAYRPSCPTACYISIRRLIVGCALGIGGTYQYTRSRWEMAMANGRGKKLFIALLVICAVVIPVSIVLTRDDGESDNASAYNVTMDERREFIYQRIVVSGMSLKEELNKEGTPQNLAWEWIVSGDHGDLSHEHEYLLSRYALAVFFYSTHGDFIHPNTTSNATDIEQVVVDGHDVEEVEKDSKVNSPDWINQNRWMSNYGICAWQGIKCHHRPGTQPLENEFDDEGDVIVVNMTANNIRGTIPRELFVACPYIRWMSLSDNGLFGELPSEIGYIDDLRYLALSENDIGGTLPTEMAQMTSMNLMFLDGNNFKGPIPSEIGRMTELVDVSLFDNLMTGTLPTELGLLTKLESLYLDLNNFVGTLPTELGAIKYLDDLRVRHNHIIGTIPTELSNLVKIEALYLDRNELSGTIPTELGALKYTKELHLYGNKFSGAIPTELANLRALTSLYLDNNHLTGGIPTEFGELINLVELYCHKNYMQGTIPTEVGKMSNLQNLRIYTNGLHGTLPDEIGNAWQLDHLYIHDNLLTGTIPESITNMTRLQKLRLYWNEFTGVVPDSICDLTDFKLMELKADCSGEEAQLKCSCCTTCYS